MRFQDKVVVVTGSSGAIGRALVKRFAAEGAKVVVHSKTNVASGEALTEEIRTFGAQAVHVQADLTDVRQVQAFFEQVIGAYHRVDILINNAGATVGGGAFLDTTKEDWLSAFDANLFAAVLCSREAARHMLSQGSGKIINTSSVRGIAHTGRQSIMAYSAAKAALINFTKTLAKELAPSVTVNAVAPGFVYTPNYDNMTQELKDSFVEATLIKRFITTEEVSDAFLFLAESSVITGQVIVVDGGFTLKLQ